MYVIKYMHALKLKQAYIQVNHSLKDAYKMHNTRIPKNYLATLYKYKVHPPPN